MFIVEQPDLSASLAASPNGLSLQSLAVEVDRVLRAHFSCSALPAWQVGIGELSHAYEPLPLAETIKRETCVSMDVATEVAGVIRATDRDKFHHPHWRYVNEAERRACLTSFWPNLRGDTLDALQLNGEQANLWVQWALLAIERLAPSAFRVLGSETVFWRGRVDENFSLRGDIENDPYQALTAPPAGNPHRLNAQGVRCFYGASDLQTCLSELRVEAGWVAYVARFVAAGPIPVLDLKLLADMPWPSVFHPDYERRVTDFGLIRGIPYELSHAPWKGGVEHAHRPAQYFAEYCRQRVMDRIKGVVFPSSQNPEGFNVALFAATWDGDNDPIRLTSVHSMRIRSRTTEATGVEMGIPGVEPLST